MGSAIVDNLMTLPWTPPLRRGHWVGLRRWLTAPLPITVKARPPPHRRGSRKGTPLQWGPALAARQLLVSKWKVRRLWKAVLPSQQVQVAGD